MPDKDGLLWVIMEKDAYGTWIPRYIYGTEENARKASTHYSGQTYLEGVMCAYCVEYPEEEACN